MRQSEIDEESELNELVIVRTRISVDRKRRGQIIDSRLDESVERRAGIALQDLVRRSVADDQFRLFGQPFWRLYHNWTFRIRLTGILPAPLAKRPIIKRAMKRILSAGVDYFIDGDLVGSVDHLPLEYGRVRCEVVSRQVHLQTID